METLNKSGKIRMLFFLALALALGNFLVGNFGVALASRQTSSSSRFLPLVLHQSNLPTAGGKVAIVDMSFQPAAITVHVGEKVEWENQDQTSHTTTSDTAKWDSGVLAPGDKFSFVFTTPGDYAYHCAIHSTMTGIVHVIPDP